VNDGQISLASPPNVHSGDRAVQFSYNIKNPAPDDYCGFEQIISAQDWRPYSVLEVWVQSDGSDMDLVIQFREASLEMWRYRVRLSGFYRTVFELPLDEGTFELADWSPRQNGRIDLDAIDYYGFFVGQGALAPGTIYIDDIQLR